MIVLSDVAELPGPDRRRARRAAKERAEEELASDAEDEEAQAALARAEVRLEVAAEA